MYFSPEGRALGDIVKKVQNGERLAKEDGLSLLKSDDLLAVGYMANLVRERKNGAKTYFVSNSSVDKDCMDTHATMLYGQGETFEKLIDDLLTLREAQDKTKSFLSFAPVQLGGSENTTTGYEDIIILAVARLMLDNFGHIKASWITLGTKLAQVSLAFGVDDIDGGDAEAKQTMSVQEIVDLIQRAGRTPVERDKLYHSLREDF